MMEEDTDVDLEEPTSERHGVAEGLVSELTSTEFNKEFPASKEETVESMTSTHDTSSTSVVGEMTGKLEDEDLMDLPALLTSSSKNTPLHTSGESRDELIDNDMGTQAGLEKPQSNIPLGNDYGRIVMENVDLSESHSSYSDLGLSLNTDSSSYDRVSPALDSCKLTNDDKLVNEERNTNSIPETADTSVLNSKTDISKPETTEVPDVTSYFKNLVVDDPFDITNTEVTSTGQFAPLTATGPSAPLTEQSTHTITNNVAPIKTLDALSTTNECKNPVTGFQHAGTDVISTNAGTLGLANDSLFQQSDGAMNQTASSLNQSTDLHHEHFEHQTNHCGVSAPNATNLQSPSHVLPPNQTGGPPVAKTQGSATYYAPPGASAVGSSDFGAQIEAKPASFGQLKDYGSFNGTSQLSKNIEQASNQVPLFYNPIATPQYQGQQLTPLQGEGQSYTNYVNPQMQLPNDQLARAVVPNTMQPNFPDENGFYGVPNGQSIPLFVPSVYNYSAKPMYQPQIFTPAPQDFSSHMTYSSSPSKYYDESEGIQGDHQASGGGDKEGLWSWVKHTVNADWAEGAQKIGKQLIEKTKHATDTVLTTLDPGMEEYLNPVINIAVASKQDDILQGVRQGFRNVFGHSAVKGENVCHNQAPLPVGFQSGIAAVYEKLNELDKMNFSFQGSYISVAAEVFLTELEQQRWSAMYCVGVRDSRHGIDIRTFSQPIPVTYDCVNVAYSKSSEHELLSGYGISIDEAVRHCRPTCDKDWCYALSGVNLQTVIVLASQFLAADYKRYLEALAPSNGQVQLQF